MSKEQQIAEHFRQIMEIVGYPPGDDPELAETPYRFARFLLEYTEYEDENMSTVFESVGEGMVGDYGIPFYS